MEVVLIAVVAILIGSILQRLSGTGVGLVVAPTLAVVMGPALGVLTTNATTVVSGFLIMLAVRRDVDWRRYALIAPAAAVGAVPAALLVATLPAAWLQVIIGTVVLLALATTFGAPNLPRWSGRAPTLLAGAIGGFFNTTAGVAAPVMVVYAKLSRWDHRPFAATLQPTFMTMGALSVIVKSLVGTTDLHRLPEWWFWPIVVTTVVVGVGIGSFLTRYVPGDRARLLAIGLAGLGGVVVLVRGLLAL